MQTEFVVQTRGPGLYEFTRDLCRWTASCGPSDGVVTLLVRHTSCSLLIQENADPDVQADLQADLQAFFCRLVPRGDDPAMRWLTHTMEGPDDMPAHIRAAMLPVTLSLPVAGGVPMLGTWQGVYLFEHRDRPHQRRVAASFIRAETSM